MEKSALIDAVLADLRRRLETLSRAANETKAEANDSENRQESKYDTRGIEAGYLAQGQAKEAASLSDAIAAIEGIVPGDLGPGEPAGVGALVEVRNPAGAFHYFLLPSGGGIEIDAGGTEVTILTPSAPLGRLLMGKMQGDTVQLSPGALKGEVTAVR